MLQGMRWPQGAVFIMDILECKEKIVAICERLGAGLPYETDQINAETWDDLADEAAELASFVSRSAARIAAYAGAATKKAQVG